MPYVVAAVAVAVGSPFEDETEMSPEAVVSMEATST